MSGSGSVVSGSWSVSGSIGSVSGSIGSVRLGLVSSLGGRGVFAQGSVLVESHVVTWFMTSPPPLMDVYLFGRCRKEEVIQNGKGWRILVRHVWTPWQIPYASLARPRHGRAWTGPGRNRRGQSLVKV